jgi:hypothetical protein
MKCTSYSDSARKWKTTELGNSHQKRLSLLQRTRMVRQISSHFEYLKNRSRGLDKLGSLQRRPYCTSVNSHSPGGLVSGQGDAADWACVLCDRRNDNDQASRSARHDNTAAHSTAPMQAFLVNHCLTQVCQPPYSPDLTPCDLWFFPKLK